MPSKSYIESEKRRMERKRKREESGTSFTHTHPESEKEYSLRGSQFTTSFERQMVAEKEYKERRHTEMCLRFGISKNCPICDR